MANDEDLFPTLKVSPPIPVGRLAGRFKLLIWRVSSDFQLKLPLGASRQGEVVVMKDASHLGIYQGDEVLSINDFVVQDLRQAKELLDQSGQEIEIHFYHKEADLIIEEDFAIDTVCCAPVVCSHRTMPVWCDFFYNPPEPRCKAQSWRLREALAASKAKELPGNIWQLRLQRYSLKQSFGLPFGLLPFDSEVSEMSNLASEDGLLATPKALRTLPVSESFTSDMEVDAYGNEEVMELAEEIAGSPVSTSGTILLLQPLPLLGLHCGDELLRVNGREISDLKSFQAATKHLMTIRLDFHRKTHAADVAASPVLLNTIRRSEDWHSVSTKDCSHDTPDGGWPIMLYKSSCRPGQSSAETVDAVESSRSFSKSFEFQDVVFL